MRIVRLAIVSLALAAAILPIPSQLVEAWYSRRVYPAIQAVVTPFSNTVPVALLDVAIGVLVVAVARGFRRRVRAAGFVRALAGGFVTLATLTATMFVAFLILWGLNYRRVPLEQKVEFDHSRVTREAALRLGEHAVRVVNAEHAMAHSSGEDHASLEAAFASAQRMLGNQRLAVPGVPKRSLLELYFRKAAIDGMTDPFFLEIIVNPDALPVERPFVLTHEWAHLAGYAHEAEASFVAWLACMRGNSLARYSGWMAIYEQVSASLPKADRSLLAAHLAPGPRRDLEEIATRYARSSPLVRNTAREVYDTYLRANRVSEGIASYTGVVRLVLGSGVQDGQGPWLRETR